MGISPGQDQPGRPSLTASRPAWTTARPGPRAMPSLAVILGTARDTSYHSAFLNRIRMGTTMDPWFALPKTYPATDFASQRCLLERHPHRRPRRPRLAAVNPAGIPRHNGGRTLRCREDGLPPLPPLLVASLGLSSTRLLSAVHGLPSQQASHHSACPTVRHHPIPSSPMAHSVHGLHHRPAADTPTQRRHLGGGRLLHQNGTLPAYHHHSHGASVEPASSSTASRCLHGLPLKIISDGDTRFTSAFWQTLMEMWGTEAALSTAFHPQTDGQTERLESYVGADASNVHRTRHERLGRMAPAMRVRLQQREAQSYGLLAVPVGVWSSPGGSRFAGGARVQQSSPCRRAVSERS
jgi:hypothetical protein